MLKKLLRDLRRSESIYDIPQDLTSAKLGYYYFNFVEKRISAGKDQQLIQKFDADGIPVNRTYIDVTEKDYVYFPISIGQMGLAVFHTWLQSGAGTDRERFLKFPQWYAHHAQLSDTLGARWLTDVPLPQYKNPGPWQSAFSQSRAISIMLRGWQLTGEERYAELAERALRSFTMPVAEGGVTSFTEWGPFYEEYTAAVPTLVLNGMVFSLCGIYDFIRVFTENNLARKIFDDGIETLVNILPKYDLGFWSRYNLCRADWHPQIDPATIGYQRLHVTQLTMLHRLTGKEIFRQYAQKFRTQDTWSNRIKMYLLKYKSLKKIGRL